MNYNNLHFVIERSKLTKRDIANRSKISRQTLDAIISGADAKISTLEAIAAALGVPVSVFFEEDEVVVSSSTTTHGNNSPIGDGNVITAADTAADTAAMKQQLADKDAIIASLRDTIAAQRDTIELLKQRI